MSANLCGMEISGEQRAALAHLVERERSRRFNTKSAAYKAAGLNSGTWGRIETGLSVKPHTLRAALLVLWPETGGDWSQVLSKAPAESAEKVAVTALSNRELIDELARRLERAGEEHGPDGSAAIGAEPDARADMPRVEAPTPPDMSGTADSPGPTPESQRPGLN